MHMIALLNLVWVDLAHSPAVSLVPTWPSQKTSPRLVRLDKVRFRDLVPGRKDRPIVLSYQCCCSLGNRVVRHDDWGED